MKITYFVHSITTDNELGNATGWLNGNLSAEGIKRAKALGPDLQKNNFDAVFCSDLTRAIESTKLFFDSKYPVFIDWRLRECNYGDYDGTPAKRFKKDREQEYINTPYPGGESYKDVEARIESFLRDAKVLYPNGQIAIVSHQAPQLALDVLVKKQTWEQAIANDWRKKADWQPGWQYEVIV